MRRAPLVLAVALALGGCGLFGAPDAAPASAVQPGALKPGDRLRITVVGEEELSGVFQVGEDRMVHLELVGAVPAGGLTLAAFEDILRDRLAAGYLKNPQILVARVAAPPPGAVAQPRMPSLPAPVLRPSQ
jgi:polysaccharide export outer membrane protein